MISTKYAWIYADCRRRPLSVIFTMLSVILIAQIMIGDYLIYGIQPLQTMVAVLKLLHPRFFFHTWCIHLNLLIYLSSKIESSYLCYPPEEPPHVLCFIFNNISLPHVKCNPYYKCKILVFEIFLKNMCVPHMGLR